MSLKGSEVTAQSLAKAAYTAPVAVTRTARSIEYDVFARITHQLRAALVAGSQFAALARALHENRTLWATLATDIAENGNALPVDLRARLFYLAEFTAHHSRKVLAGQADANTLIDINTAVMRGLRPAEDKA